MFPSKAINPNSILKGTANKYIYINNILWDIFTAKQKSQHHSQDNIIHR